MSDDRPKKPHYLPAQSYLALNRAVSVVDRGLDTLGIFLVGSCLERPDFRDVDDRAIMADEAFEERSRQAVEHLRPALARGLLELCALRLACLASGVTSLVVLPARVGVRSTPVVRVTNLELSISQQTRVRRTYGSRAYSEDTKELRVEVASDQTGPTALLELLGAVLATPPVAND